MSKSKKLKKRCTIDTLESRRMFAAAAPLGINFNDEATWDSNFAAATSKAKSLGVQSVRLWFGFQSYDARPNAWEPYTPYGAVAAGEVAAADATADAMSRTMTRAFQLKRAGFNVLAVLQNTPAEAPSSAAQAKGFVRHLMDATETADGTQTLADVIDYWEIGNETDSANYWLPSGVNKAAGLKSYVNTWLIPAAEELHAGTPDQWEKVVSAGVSYSPADLGVIVAELQNQNALDDVDYLGFHPYGVVNSSTNDIAKNTTAALGYANAVGKQLIATEWNVRGFGNAGANDAAWAKTMDNVYRSTIAPNFKEAYYFALVNNWAGRGGSTSARPGGLLKHDTTLAVTPTSDVLKLRDYYNSPLINAEPFYATFDGWQYGQVSGTVADQAIHPSGMAASPVTVYIDVNCNGTFDAAEPFALTNAAGAYTIRYSTNDLTAGTYSLAVVATDSITTVGGSVDVSLAALTTTTGVNFTIQSTPAALENLGTLTGTLFKDADNDGTQNAAEAGLANWTVYLDLNGNGTLDAAEPTSITAANGAYAFVYDTTTIGDATMYVRAVLQGNYLAGNTPAIAAAAGVTQSGVNVAVRSSFGSITGLLWNDVSGDGVFNDTDSFTGSRVVYIDANRNGKLDKGELQTTSDAASRFTFANLPAGTYYVTRVFPAGYRLSNGTGGYMTVTIAAGQDAAGIDIGSTNKPAPVPVKPTVPTVPTTPTTPTTPTVPVKPTVGGSIAGKLFTQSKLTAAMLTLSWKAYVDANNNGKFDDGETFASVSRTDGTFAFAGLAAGSYTVGLTSNAGWKATAPTTSVFKITLKAGQAKTGQNFTLNKA